MLHVQSLKHGHALAMRLCPTPVEQHGRAGAKNTRQHRDWNARRSGRHADLLSKKELHKCI